MSICQQVYQRLYQAIKEDERYCLCCHERLRDTRDLRVLFFNDQLLCQACKDALKLHKRVYWIDGIYWHVLYEYNDFLERLLFQFKEQRDYELKDVFLFDFKKLRYTFHAYNVCALCSSEEKRMFRGFEPVIEIFKSLHIFVYSPFYKCLDMKQSSQAKKEREKIRSIIQLKSCYPMSNRPILLVDDVCTTGASLNRGIELIHPDCVFVLAAHPLWIQEKQENIVDKSSVFW